MIIAAATAVLLLAPQTAPQTAPAATPPAQDFTSSLNSGPPRPADYLAPAPAPVTPPPAPASAPAPATRETPTPAATRPAAPAPTTAPPPAARPAPAPVTAPAPARPTETPPPARPPAIPPTPTAAPTPVRPAATPPARPAATPTPAPAPSTPAPAVAEPPPPPSAPAVTVLDGAARAALPFTVDLPSGFEIVTGRPGPDFKIYTIRRGDRSFAMVYAGPASQFPIYSGQQVEAAGRLSVVAAEGNERHALEHLFQRPDAPREIHVWTMSLEGADRALAERIAGSVDVR